MGNTLRLNDSALGVPEVGARDEPRPLVVPADWRVVEEDVPEPVVDLLEGDVVVGERVAQEDLGFEQAERSRSGGPADLAVGWILRLQRSTRVGRRDGVQIERGKPSPEAVARPPLIHSPWSSRPVVVSGEASRGSRLASRQPDSRAKSNGYSKGGNALLFLPQS